MFPTFEGEVLTTGSPGKALKGCDSFIVTVKYRLSFIVTVKYRLTRVQPRWIQGIRSRDGVSDQETIAYLNAN